MICCFRLNIYMFFISNLPHFSPLFNYFTTWLNIFEFIIISLMKFAYTVFIQSKYIHNQMVYYFGDSIFGNPGFYVVKL